MRECSLGGLVLGLALLAKSTGALLFPVLLAGFLVKGDKRPSLRHAAAAFALAILIALPWLVRNQNLYGDPLAIGAFQQASVGNLPYAEAVRNVGGVFQYWFSFVLILALQGFWGVFGYYDIFLPSNLYWLLAVLGALTVVGFLLRFAKAEREERKYHWLALALVICIGAGFVSYNLTYFQAQGRYLYPAIFGIASIAGFGVWGLAGGNLQKFRIIGGTWIGLLIALNLYVSFWLLIIAFRVIEECK